MTGPDLDDLLTLATDVAAEAASMLIEGLDRARASVQTKSTGTDMVSELDRASEQLIAGRITAARPDDGFVGEEGTTRPNRSGIEWVVDPLDGTTNYLYQYPTWNVSIGARLEGEPILGVVAVPSLDEITVAARGRGAHCNGSRLEVTDPPPIETSLVGTGFGYDPAMRVAQAEKVVGIIGRVRDLRRSGAAATDLTALAQGRLDCFYEWGLNDWDSCAGMAIAAEAGCRVEVVATDDVTGRTLTVGAHVERFAAFLDLLTECGITDPP